METDFIYWRHPTPPGIKVEEISGREDMSGELWRKMAMQVYSENGKDGYREVDHFPSGAPFLEGSDERISISHTKGLLVVATLPRTPEITLNTFNPRSAMGIDAERADREQVLKLRERFLNKEELAMIDAESVEANITAWTVKEALYKAALTPGLDIRESIIIKRLPVAATTEEWVTELKKSGDIDKVSKAYGEAEIILPDSGIQPMKLYSYRSDDCIVTLAYSPKTATFIKYVS